MTAVCAIALWVTVRFRSPIAPVDFYVYRYAAAAALHGVNIYAVNPSGPLLRPPGLPFTYTPFAALALIPTVVGSMSWAYLAWCAANLAVLAWAVVHFVPVAVRRRSLAVSAALLLACLTCVMAKEIEYGQINVLLMGLCLADLARSDQSVLGRCLPRGVLVGVAAAIKLTPLLFIAYFVLTRQWRLARWSGLGVGGAFALGWLAFPQLSHDFFSTVIWGLSGRVDLGDGFASFGNNSVQGALAAVGPWTHLISLPLTGLVGILALLAARLVHRQAREADAWLIIGLAAPMLSPVSWIHHWVYLLPALVTLAFRVRSTAARSAIAVALVALYLGPGDGDRLVRHGPQWLLPLGVGLRECLLLTSAAAIVALCRTTAPLATSDRRR